MGFLSKKKEDNSNQTVKPADAPAAPPDLQVPNTEQSNNQTEDGSATDDLPELPPLDLPDLDESEGSSHNEDTQSTDQTDSQTTVSSQNLTNDSQKDATADSSSSPMDNLDIPTDLNATEPVDEDTHNSDNDDSVTSDSNQGVESDNQVTSQVTNDESQEEEPVVAESQQDSYTRMPSRVQSRFHDFSSPLFIEQGVYLDSLEDVYHAKTELVQIQKFTSLTKDLDEHVGEKFESYKDTLLNVQKKVLYMEKKLFEE